MRRGILRFLIKPSPLPTCGFPIVDSASTRIPGNIINSEPLKTTERRFLQQTIEAGLGATAFFPMAAKVEENAFETVPHSVEA